MRKKTYQTRSRKGCRTCRARHVKCDETPGSCKRCIVSGFKCEGYDDVRLSNLTKQHRNVRSSLVLQRIADNPGIGPEEKRGFAFFQHMTVPNLTGLFNTRIWTELILPLSHEDRAVNHALLAVSALHEDTEIRGAPLSRENLAIQLHRFALSQYGRSIAILNERRHSQDPKLREIILVCCLLFIICDLMRGQYDQALLHIKQGIAIIEEPISTGDHASVSTKSPVMVRRCLATALMRFKTQCYHYGLNPTPFAFDIEGPDVEYGFPTLYEARNALESAISRLIVLLAMEKRLATEELRSDNMATLIQTQKDIRHQFEQFNERLAYSESHTLNLHTDKDQRGLKVIHVHYTVYVIVLETALCQDNRNAFSSYMNEFHEIVELCTQISGSFKSNDDSRPTLVLDMGVNASLFYVTWRCTDLKLRLQALKLLELWPHREGLWDSRLLVLFANQMLKLEGEFANSRDNEVLIGCLEVQEDQRFSILRYQVYRPSLEKHENHERILPIDDGY